MFKGFERHGDTGHVHINGEAFVYIDRIDGRYLVDAFPHEISELFNTAAEVRVFLASISHLLGTQ